MKVVKLVAENIKRLSAVHITPEGSLITIGGKNEAGKSSVLDAIAMALGGATLVPDEPIRRGESSGKVEVDLGEFIVTRKFTREVIVAADQEKNPQAAARGLVPPIQYGPTKSSLIIRNKEGATYPSPQAMLDKLLGKLTFDPLQFAQMKDEKVQAEVLRKVIGLDTSDLDQARKAAYDRRTEFNRAVEKLSFLLKETKFYDEVKEHASEISLDEISQQMGAAEQARRAHSEAERKVTATQAELIGLSNKCEHYGNVVSDLMAELEQAQKTLAEYETQRDLRKIELAGFEADEASLKVTIPDTSAIQARLSEVEGKNAKIRVNQQYRKIQAELVKETGKVAQEKAAIENADKAKLERIAAAKFPVPGLGLSDLGVLYDGIPLKQVSTGKQMEVSTAIGLALNKNIKVLLIRNGSLLDSDALKAIATMAEAADAQVWMEYMTENPEGVQVMLEDGTQVKE